MTPRTTRILSGIAAAITVLAITLQMIPVRVSLPEAPGIAGPLPTPVADPSEQAAALLAYEELVRANPFDADRKPPSERFVPPDFRSTQQQARPADQPVAPRLQLFGVATGPMGAVALIDANPSIPGAEIYRLGDRVSVYQLESISDTEVVLRGDSGVRRLRLLIGRSR